jgi:hypothetical protein
MALLPLLHVASDTASRAMSVDWRVVAAGAVATLVVCAVAFAPRSPRRWVSGAGRMRLSRRTRRRVALLVMQAAVVAAVLPSVLPYDHVLPSPGGGDAGERATHELHCHVSPATCSDAPLTSGPGQLVQSDALLVAPHLLTTRVETREPQARGLTIAPVSPPPRA